ncbi:hypothetical protein ZHAS_00019527 [Anopheles sinensis]|uniref:Uncharacterized protein n=1 Tax=Anopheles sinensis TaxID=74873 RepID=A0A084WMM8_ANOSI|nr:hypothetical protein ZHAS_00019527 [Anopheles sinensis]
MASSIQQLIVVVAALIFVCAANGLESYFETENSDSQECSLGEDNRLPYPYAMHGKPPQLGECADCGFVIVEKRHHYCIPGKSVIKVLRRKPTCNCKHPLGRRDGSLYGTESKVVPNYVMASGASQGPSPVAESMVPSDQVSRMLRTLISDRGNYGAESDKTATPQYRTLDSNSATRTYN